MSIVLKQEIERLKAILKDDPNDVEARKALLKVERDLAEYKPATVVGGVCESCEG